MVKKFYFYKDGEAFSRGRKKVHQKIPTEMEVAPPYKLLTLFTLFTLLKLDLD